MTRSPDLDGSEHLFQLEAARRWLSDGGNPCELQRSNPAGTRRQQPVWTFWWQQAHQLAQQHAWQDLLQHALHHHSFDPWLPDQNGDPSWWRTLCQHGDDAPAWSRHWLDQGLDPNRWNADAAPTHPCLLAAWMRTARGTSMAPTTVVALLNDWVQERALNPHAIEAVTGDGAWHWLATQRPLSSLDGQIGLATWLLEREVSPERRNRAGVSGWEAWSATMPIAALNAVAPLWAQQQHAALASDHDLGRTTGETLRSTPRARL